MGSTSGLTRLAAPDVRALLDTEPFFGHGAHPAAPVPPGEKALAAGRLRGPPVDPDEPRRAASSAGAGVLPSSEFGAKAGAEDAASFTRKVDGTPYFTLNISNAPLDAGSACSRLTCTDARATYSRASVWAPTRQPGNSFLAPRPPTLPLFSPSPPSRPTTLTDVTWTVAPLKAPAPAGSTGSGSVYAHSRTGSWASVGGGGRELGHPWHGARRRPDARTGPHAAAPAARHGRPGRGLRTRRERVKRELRIRRECFKCEHHPLHGVPAFGACGRRAQLAVHTDEPISLLTPTSPARCSRRQAQPAVQADKPSSPFTPTSPLHRGGERGLTRDGRGGPKLAELGHQVSEAIPDKELSVRFCPKLACELSRYSD